MESQEKSNKIKYKRGILFSVLIATLMIIGMVQLIIADEDDDDLPPGSSPYAQSSKSDDELLKEVPSIDRYLEAHTISPDRLIPADLSSSTKTVNRESALSGSTVQYTVVISNSGDSQATVTLTDSLPSEVTYINHEVEYINAFPPNDSENNGVVTWQGSIGANGQVTFIIEARVNDNVPADTIVTNSAQLNDGNTDILLEASFTVFEIEGSPISQLPFIVFDFTPDPPDVTLSATRPNSNNEWVVSWTSGPGAQAYQLEVAQSSDFSEPTSFDMGSATSKVFNPSPSTKNVYYYRARSQQSGVYGNWSNVVEVVSGYRDDFTNPNSGWDIRRTTNIDKVKSWYEIEPENNKDWLILQVHDRWDWGISSPLMPAPDVPYVIDYEAKAASIGNLVSLGAVWGGDYNGNETCPDKSTVEGWYEHRICFNHFYNANTIWFANLKLLFERVDELVWCPDCGGSPMKRLGDLDQGNNVVELHDVNAEGWNHYRVEVRENSIKFFAGKRGGQLHLQYEYDDTRWIGDPFFGVFGSTDEYNNSTGRFEYYQVMPLDS